MNIFKTCKGIIERRLKKMNFFEKLVRNNTGVSSKNFFLVSVTIAGVVMLFVLIAGFIVDMIFNHTITINLSDAGSYIAAVAAMFGAAGVTKAWTEWSENKFIDRNNNGIPDEQEDVEPSADEEPNLPCDEE